MKVVFRFRPAALEAGGTRPTEVLLLGETSDWRNPVAMRPSEDGFVCELDLPRGVYQYKFLVDKAWTLDAGQPRTRSDGGHVNSVCVVDGADEPFLFAAAPPWVEPLSRGGVRILFGLRHGTGIAPRVTWTEGRAAAETSLTAAVAFEEDQHAFYEVVLPVSAPTVELRLEADRADGAGRYESRAKWSRPTARERVPTWWQAVVYTIFVDRFRPAVDRPTWATDPGGNVAAGGHLEGIRRSLDELAALGVTALYLTPVHVGASIHRYDLVDPMTVDPALGGVEAYDALVADARAHGIRVIQDVSFAHAGVGFPPYDDVTKHGKASRWASWFRWNGDDLVHYDKRTDAPLLDLEDPGVEALVLETVAYWAARGVSGLRLDMTAEVPIALGRKIRARFRELVPEGIVLGEVVPRHAWRWRAAGVVDAATDFGFHAIATDLATRPDASAARAFAALQKDERLRGGDPVTTLVRFLSTHDHPRLTTLASARDMHARVLPTYALLATLPGIVMLLYGEEVGLRSSGADRELEDVWPDRAPMPWEPRLRDPKFRDALRTLLTARRERPALREGTVKLLFADEALLVFRREAAGDVVDVVIHFGTDAKEVELQDDDFPALVVVATVGDAGPLTDPRVAGVRVGPMSAVVASRARAEGRSVGPMLARKHLALRDQGLREGRQVALGRPTRFFFSVTERCNLRCEHCITHAPEKTRTGSARTMTAAVVDALRDDFAFADYFAFVHGGESLTAPIFEELARSIADARGHEPFVSHLLTNGLLLDETVAARLVPMGVRSISVSLDGATAATNDGIRLGGRFDLVRERLARTVAWRNATGTDLRVGLSYVVLRQNLHELCAFVELASALGVDWVKLEEGVPATAFAKRSLVRCDEAAVKEVVGEAMALGRARGLVMVDHTVERVIWRCQPTTDGASFLAADEFANRCEIPPLPDALGDGVHRTQRRRPRRRLLRSRRGQRHPDAAPRSLECEGSV